jgi:hypothetical protein
MMIGFMNTCSSFVSATALLQVAGSASMFGWLLLLPTAKFPEIQERATVAVLGEALPQAEAKPIELQQVASPLVCSPGNAAKIQELMELRARVGTSLGSAEDFQVALATLIEQEGQAAPSVTPPALSPSVPPMPVQPSPPSSFANAAPQQPHLNSSENPNLNPQTPGPSVAPMWVQSQFVPNQFVAPHQTPPQTYPNQGQAPQGFQGLHSGPGQWQQPLHNPAMKFSHAGPTPPHHPQYAPHPQNPPAMIPAQNSTNHHGPVRISSNDQRNEHGPRTNDRRQSEPEQQHRIRRAARMLEESAWELEEAGEYSSADNLRRQAADLFRRARGHNPSDTLTK